MATFTIGNQVYQPRAIRDEMRLISGVLRGCQAPIIKSLAKAANLKPTVVARATANGAITFNGVEFQVFSSTGVRLTLKQACNIICSFQRAHAKACKPLIAKFRAECSKRLAAYQSKGAELRMARQHREAKKILASIDGEVRLSNRAACRIKQQHKKELAQRELYAASIRAHKAWRKQRKVAQATLRQREVPVAESLPRRRQEQCPAPISADGTSGVDCRGRTFERSRCRDETPCMPRKNSHYCGKVVMLPLEGSIKRFFQEYAGMRYIERLAHAVFDLWGYIPSPSYYMGLCEIVREPTRQVVAGLTASYELDLQRIKTAFGDHVAHAGFGWVSNIVDTVTKHLPGSICLAGAVAKEVVDHTAERTKECVLFCTDRIRNAAKAFGEGIFDAVKQQFMDCLAPFLGAIAFARDEIEKCWQYAKGWAKSMWDAVAVEVQCFAESAWWAIALLMVAGLVLMVEKMLCHLGVMSGVGVLVGTFLTLILTHIGMRVGGLGTPAEGVLYGTLRGMIEVAFLGGFSKKQTTESAQQACEAGGFLEVPLRFLQTLGNGMISAPLGTLQYIGRYGQAFDQIRKGKDALKEFMGFMFDRIADTWDYVSGRKDTFFREVASMTRIDIVKWIARAQTTLMQAQTTAVTDPILLETTTHLLYQGHELQRVLAGAQRSTSLDYGRVVGVICRELMEVRARCARVGKFEGRRCEPFWVYIYGKSHCGKSLFMEEVTRCLLQENGHALDDIYAKNARDSYWSGYMQQACVQIDDLSACVTDPSVESEFMQTVGSKAYALNMAAVEDKGMLFNSALIVTTSNVFTAPTLAQIQDQEAYKNRRGVVIQCRRAPGVEFDPDNPSASCEARLVHVVEESPLGEWANCMKVLEEVAVKAREHRYKELRLTANYRARNNARHPIHRAAHSFIQESARSMALSDIACDGKLYAYDKIREQATLLEEVPAAGHEQLCIRVMQSFNEATHPADQNLLHAFLHHMVEGPCRVESVDLLSKEATSSQREFFLTLSLLERIYLRLVQKRMDELKEVPELCFGTDIKSRVLGMVLKGYEVVKAHGGQLLCIIAAMALIYVLFYNFFTIYQSFVGGTLGAVSTMGALSQLSANAGMMSASYSSSGSVQSYATRNLPIHYRHRTASTLNAFVGERDDYLSHLVAWLELPYGEVISCIRYKARSLFLTAHQAEQISEGSVLMCSYFIKDNTVRSTKVVWRHSQVRHFADTEAVLFTASELSTMPAADLRAFDVDVERLPSKISLNATVVKLKRHMTSVDSTLSGCEGSQPVLNRWSSEGWVNRVRQGINTEVYGGTYRNELPISIASTCNTSNWDCGAIISTMFEGRRVVVGMHVASGMNNHNVHVATACLLPHVNDLTCNGSLPYIPELGVDTPGYSKLGWIPNIADRPFVGTNTMFHPVPAHLKYEPVGLYEEFVDGTRRTVEVEIKQPAILCASDSRIPEGMKYDPLVDGMKKFTKPMEVLDDALCAEIVKDMSDTWYDCFHDLEDVTDEVAINGKEEDFFDAFNMQTSEGYPWVRMRRIGESGKSRYFLEDPDTGLRTMLRDTPVFEAYENLKELSKTQVPELVCCETPKDECLPLRKITQKPKTRLFSILPLEYNLFLRVKFLDFAAKLQANRNILPTQVGINPYSREWGDIYQRIRKQSDVAINCDFECFDGLMTAQVLYHLGQGINRVYAGSGESKQQRLNLLMAVINRKSICGSQVYEVRAGIPSGCALTVLLNSALNEFLMRWVWKTVVPGVERERFTWYNTLIVYGDDNVKSTHPDMLKYFNGNIIKAKLATIGVVITDGTDKSATTLEEKTLDRIDFLKRRFRVQADGTVYAPLDLSSIFTSLQNVTLGAGSIPEAVAQNVHVVLVELYLHQRSDWYDMVRNYYVDACGWRELPRWEDTRAFHRGCITGVTPWVPHRVLDVPCDIPALQRGMANQGNAAFVAALAPGLYVCGAGWKIGDPNTQFVVSTVPLKKGEDGCGVFHKVVFGEGRGRMPTNRWVADFRSPLCALTARLVHLYRTGTHIYFRAEPPYVANWCAAIALAQGLGMDYKAMSHLYGNVCVPDSGTIYHYFERQPRREIGKEIYVCPPARFKGDAVVSTVL
uniref:Polyprotein 1 n=1 Tax=Shoestring fern seco-like virus TaxID=2933188 RepID=A0A9C7GWP6_9SECO|nr:polyprotein 1 [Shoestring fern seco-like virus]CAI5383975.1 polyprotein 1 [Shoestring fern seco-like virus]